MPHSSTSPAPALATLVLDPEVLREALIAALSDPTVVERLAAAVRGAAGTTPMAPTFMGAQEYALHARMSRRSLDYVRQQMTEGVHYSRNGRRLRYHVAAADEFLSKTAHNEPPASTNGEDDLKELARQEASRRRPKPPLRKP